MKPRKGIYRIVNHKSPNKAWSVMIRRASSASGVLKRVFSDSVHGGGRAAYRAASAWYDEMLQQYPVRTSVEKMATLRSNNRSGITGVYRWPASGADVPDAYWAAQWVIEPWQKPIRRKYSIACYGEKQAKNLATQARKEALEALRQA